MKKILSLILLIVSINSFGQTGFPGTQSMANASTRLLVNGGLEAKRGIINGVFTDTTAANSDYIDFYNGAQIYTRSDRNFWLRDSVLNMWIRMAKYSDIAAGLVNIYNSDGTLSGNRTLTGLNNTYNLAFDSLDYFRVDRDGVTRIYQNSSTSSLYSPDGNTLINITNGLTQLSVSSASNYFWGRADSFLVHKRISYEGNIHSTFYPYSLVDKSYVDSVASGGNKVDSVTVRNDSLFYWVNGTNTLVTPVVPYDFTSLTDYDILRYSSGSGSFVNTNKLEKIRWIPRQDSATSSATPTINTDNVDVYKLTAQAADITSFTTNLSGTPRHGEIIEIQITGTATRAITWGSAFVSSTVALPTTTDGTNTLTVILQYYTNSSYGNFKWVCVNYY